MQSACGVLVFAAIFIGIGVLIAREREERKREEDQEMLGEKRLAASFEAARAVVVLAKLVAEMPDHNDRTFWDLVGTDRSGATEPIIEAIGVCEAIYRARETLERGEVE